MTWYHGRQLNNQQTNHNKPNVLNVSKVFSCIQSGSAWNQLGELETLKVKRLWLDIHFISHVGGSSSDGTALVIGLSFPKYIYNNIFITAVLVVTVNVLYMYMYVYGKG